MKNETKTLIFIIFSVMFLLSLFTNFYFLGRGGSDSEQISLYKQLSEQSNITTGLLQERITGAEKTISSLRELSDEYRTTIGELQEANIRRAELDNIFAELNGRIRTEIIEGINTIDRGSARIRELEAIEQRERSNLGESLSGLTTGEEEN